MAIIPAAVVVTAAFGQYPEGALITDPLVISSIYASSQASNVVAILPGTINSTPKFGPQSISSFAGLALNAPGFIASMTGFGEALDAGYGTATSPIVNLTFTVEGFFQYPAVPTSTAVIVAVLGMFWIGIKTNGTLNAEVGLSQELTSSTAPTTGVWHHVALTVNANASGGTSYLFLDGALVTSGAVPSAAIANMQGALAGTLTGAFITASSLNVLSVGNFLVSSPPANPFAPGLIDAVAIWSTARYTVPFTPPAAPFVGTETGLLALYNLDGSGTDSTSSQGRVIGVAPTAANALRFYLGPSDSVTFGLGEPSGSIPLPANAIAISGSSGPNWDEPVAPNQIVAVFSVSGSPRFRWMST